MYKVGYIDEEKTWRNTFRQYFKEVFQVVLFDINEDTTLESLTEEVFNQNLNILVVDFRLDETGVIDFNADALIDKIKERNLFYPMIVLTSYEIDALNHLENPNLVNGKDMLEGENPKLYVLEQKILKTALEYSNTLTNNRIKLEILETKRINDQLSPAEEDEYVELNNFLDKTMNANSHISRSFYSNDTNKKLDDLITLTQNLINLIKNDKK